MQTCINLITNKEYAVKVSNQKLSYPKLAVCSLDTCKLGLIYQISDCPCCHIKHGCCLCRLFIDCCVAQWKKARLQNVSCVHVAFFSLVNLQKRWKEERYPQAGYFSHPTQSSLQHGGCLQALICDVLLLCLPPPPPPLF